MPTKNRSRRELLLTGSLAAASQLLPQTHALSPVSLISAERMPGSQARRQQLRGLMVDAGRVPEPLEYYRRVIDFCADWELNALQFRIADDQGCAIRFASAPDLLFHQNAFSPEELNRLAHYARGRSVDLIPELESFGHTGYITRSPAYAHLLDADAQLSTEFTGVIPVHPETLDLFRKLYREVSEIFPSALLHGGCDEVNWGGSALSRKALQTKQRYEIWAEYLNSLNHLAHGVGKQFVVWGDVVLHKEPKILPELNKSIVVMDWNYREKDSAKVQETLSTIRANGSRGIGAPALINYRWGPRVGTDQLANIDAFTQAYLGAEDASSLGVMLTNWVPSRYIQNSIWDGFAYAAMSFKDTPGIAQRSSFRRFVEKHYGAGWNDDWNQAFQSIYENAPQVQGGKKMFASVPLLVPWSSDDELAAALQNPSPRSNPFARLHGLVAQLEMQVSKHREDFQAFLLSVAYFNHLYWREEILVEKRLLREDAGRLIEDIANRDHTLAAALSKDWDRGRFPDSAAKLRPLFGLEPKDQLVFAFQHAANYSAALASEPDRFFRIIAARKAS